MEQLSVDVAQVFKNYLLEYFTEILKHIPKKYKDFRDLIAKKQEEVAQEKDKKQTNANKYFFIFKLSIEARIAKLTQLSIFYIEKLIAHKFIDGNGFDYTQEIAPLEGVDKRKSIQIDRNRKLIETIIDVICESVNLKDEHVHLQIIRSLLTIATSPICQVHGQSLERIMRTIIQIHCSKNTLILLFDWNRGENESAKQPQIQDPSKHAFTQIIVETFKRMERNTILSQEEATIYQQKKAIGGLASIPQSNTLLAHKPDSQVNSSSDLDLSNSHASPPLNQNHGNGSTTPNISGESLNQLAGSISEEQQKKLITSYVGRVTLSLVDDVCIYDDKVTRVQARMTNENAEQQAIDAELALIPLKSVPNPQDVDTPQYKKAIIASIANEKNAVAGKFGWCFICREEASKFCKDTRVPICSNECKQKHIDEVARITRFCYSGQEVAVNPHIVDALTVFNFLCKVSQEDPAKGVEFGRKYFFLHLKLFVILDMMESAGAVFLSRKEFAAAVQSNLLPSLLQNSLSMERQVYVLSFDIIANLIENFRANLKTEIAVFLENVFVRILESTNSAFAHRVACLRVFLKIFRIPRAVIEMFVNYDCQMDQTNIIERLIGLLTKISQGKYQKQEFSNLIQVDQAIELKNLAIQSISQLMSGINDFVTVCDEQQISSAISEKNLVNTKEEFLEASDVMNASSKISMTSSSAVEEVRDAIEEERLRKLQFQKGIQKFNLKAKVGIKHWITQKLIEEGNAKDLSDIFFKFNKSLSHEKIGEVFGSSDEFNRRVLAEFIENLQFEEQDIVNSLRRFLTYFQLPGEGEQVDRILEKFGEKYSLDNPNSYKNAGTPYTLSYALMMLHTSTHSQQVLEKERMTLPQFQKLIKKIDDGQDLPDEVSVKMFQEIKKSPLGIHHLEESKKALEDALNLSSTKKQELFMKETEQIFEKGKLMIQSGKETKSYIMVFTKDYISSLLQIVWSPVFASLSQAMLEQENIDMVNAILLGFRSSIRLLGQFGMITERETFVFELCRLTGLFSPHKLIRSKNVQSIKATLKVATVCRNYLGRSWKIILECLSKLDNYFLIGQNLRRDIDIMHTEIQVETNLLKEEVDKYNSQVIIKYIDQSEIDKIFHCSNLFDGETIVEFIRCLCELSQEELEDQKNPRIFCIQRIGEVTEFNMQRVRIVWNKIWEILKSHYNRIGCHSNSWVSSLAIDSLKQLAVKFLEKPELSHYQFQKDFLSPFEYIFQNYPHQGSDVKELILSCLSMMTNSRALHLRSGWKTILRVVNLTLQEDNPRLVELAVSITDVIMNQKSLDNLMDVFGDLIHALTSQTKYKIESIAVKALEYLKKCIEYLVDNTLRDQMESQKKQQAAAAAAAAESGDSAVADQSQVPSGQLATGAAGTSTTTTKKTQILISESKKLLEGYLIPILSNFASFFSDERPKIIGKSVAYLFESIKQYSYTFNAEFWSLILGGALRPLFDDMQFIFSKSKFTSQDVYKASKNASQKAFSEFVALMAEKFDTLHHCLPDFLSIMHNSIAINQETLSTISLNSLKSFLTLAGSKLNESEWDIIINSLVQLSVNCQPEEILAARSYSNEFNIPIEELLSAPVEYKKFAMKIDFQKNIVQCVIFKNMITFIIDIFESFSTLFTDTQIDTITNILQNHLTFAEEFNSRIYLRFYLWKNGLNSGLETLPVLGRQEKLARCGILLIQYEQYKRNTESGKYLDLFLTSTESYLQELSDILKELKSIGNEQKAVTTPSSTNQQNGGTMKTEGQQHRPSVSGKQPTDTVNLNEILKGHAIEDKKRQVKSLRHIIGSSILPNLSDIHPTLFEARLQSLVNLLIEVSNQDLSFEDGFNHNLKVLLAKYFNHVFSQIPQKKQAESSE